MPSKPGPQARLMAACAHGADYPSCPPTKVAREFNQADKRAGNLGSKLRAKPTRRRSPGRRAGKANLLGR